MKLTYNSIENYSESVEIKLASFFPVKRKEKFVAPLQRLFKIVV